MSRTHGSGAGREREGEDRELMEELRSVRCDSSSLPYAPSELVASGPRHGIKTSLCEVINSDRFLGFVGLLEDTALS